jgi:hypothetical protein
MLPSGFLDPYLTSEWSGNNQYRSGKLRAIDQTVFKLDAVNRNHDWANVRDNTDFLGDGIDPITLSSTADAIVDSHVDKHFDAIMIRIVGRGAISGSTTDITRTQLLFHCISNQELVYSQNTIPATFHTRGNVVSNFIVKAVSTAKGTPKATGNISNAKGRLTFS